jgi:hypothetical protein
MAVPPNIEQLREARAWWDDAPEDATYIPEYIPEYDDAISDAIDWLLSLAESGGRLVVEQPCEHGVVHDDCDQLVCGHELCGDGWYIDARPECWCPGGSRRVVWPPKEGE